MPHRRTDDMTTDPAPFDDRVKGSSVSMQPIFKFDRSISAWQIGTVLVALIFHGTLMWATVQSQSDQVKSLAATVQKLLDAGQQATLDRQRAEFAFDNLSKRVAELERRTAEIEQRVSAIERKVKL